MKSGKWTDNSQVSIMAYKADFPIFDNHDIAYLDNAATTQRPRCVIEAERNFYETCNANPLRGVYDLAVEATAAYEGARSRVRAYINAGSDSEIIFTRNATEALNLVAYSYALGRLHPGDEILVSIAEHHSNLLPWQMVSERTGARLVFLECDADGVFDDAQLALISDRTKLAAVTAVSNVLGEVLPVSEIIRRVHEAGGVAVIDGAQAAAHSRLDMQKLKADFYAWSGHKVYGPMGIGVLYGRRELLEEMEPFLRGGEMIERVGRESATWAELPAKFEAGTVNAAGAVGLAAALDYIERLSPSINIPETETALTQYAMDRLTDIPHLHILGQAPACSRCGIISFTLDGAHPHDIAEILGSDGICVRAGHHCAQPLLAQMGIGVCARASFSFYNDTADIDRLATSLSTVRARLGLGRK